MKAMENLSRSSADDKLSVVSQHFGSSRIEVDDPHVLLDHKYGRGYCIKDGLVEIVL